MDLRAPPFGRLLDEDFSRAALRAEGRRSAAQDSADALRDASGGLHEVVAVEVIPRLLVSLRATSPALRPTLAHVDTLLRLSLASGQASAAGQLCALRASGMATPVLLDGLLTPVARRLGEMWASDEIDFVAVAIAASKLVVAVRQLDRLSRLAARPGAPLALFATPPSERHGLGALCVSAAFRDAGWRSCEALGASAPDLAQAVGAVSYDLVGLSASSAGLRRDVASTVSVVRKASRNRHAIIAVGGAACLEDPDFAAHVGADISACGCAEAIAAANARLPRRRRLGLEH